MKRLALFLALALGLFGCSASGPAPDINKTVAQVNAAIPAVFQHGCAAVSYADGAFQAVAPALVAAGRLPPDGIMQERAIFSTAQAQCATPPTDAVTAGLALLGQASAIYLLIGQKG